MSYLGAAILAGGFVTLAHLLGVADRVRAIAEQSRCALSELRSQDLGAEAKEQALQDRAKGLFFLLLGMTGIFCLSLALPLGVVVILEVVGLLSLDEAIAASVSWPFAITATIIMVFLFAAGRIHRTSEFSGKYGAVDRLLHLFLFKVVSSQVVISDLEDALFRNRLAKVEIFKPVFITGLPRSGTTLLLNIMASLPQFASHVYRDMPFVLCPVFWHRLSSPFRKSASSTQRTHGDGMLVSHDNPEAFEEIIWRLFWPTHYLRDRITVWKSCNDPQFTAFYKNHMRKIIALRAKDGGSRGGRYVSKNNMNISRVSALHEILPSSIVIVPFREPLQHAASLLRQHRRFLRIHKKDSFARRYMEDIGHFDFGVNLKPVDFNNWLGNALEQDTRSMDFWMRYWIATYDYIYRECRDQVHLLSYDRLCAQPRETLHCLGEAVGAGDVDALPGLSHMVREAGSHEVNSHRVSHEILEKALQLHRQLERTSVF